jgi:hypothetical protein
MTHRMQHRSAGFAGETSPWPAGREAGSASSFEREGSLEGFLRGRRFDETITRPRLGRLDWKQGSKGVEDSLRRRQAR